MQRDDPAQYTHELEIPGHGTTTVLDLPGPSAAAPTVLLLHGLGATARLNWRLSLAALARHFRVLAVDHRGHGRGLRTERFALERCADDAAAVAEIRGAKQVIAVGYSMGGPIASLAWRRHRDLVCGLVLCATARHFMPPAVAIGASLALPVAAQLARLAPSRAHDRLVERMIGRVEDPVAKERIRSEFEGHDPSSVIQAAQEVSGFSSHDWIGGVDVPTSVVVTTRDEMVPTARQRKLAASIRGAEVFEISGDHLVCARPRSGFPEVLVAACRSVEHRLEA